MNVVKDDFAKTFGHRLTFSELLLASLSPRTLVRIFAFHLRLLRSIPDLMNNDLDFITIGYKIGMGFVPFLFAICFLEYAHGWVAKLKGDNTPEMMGRLTLNPM